MPAEATAAMADFPACVAVWHGFYKAELMDSCMRGTAPPADNPFICYMPKISCMQPFPEGAATLNAGTRLVLPAETYMSISIHAEAVQG